MNIGLQITKNKNKYKRLISLLNHEYFKNILFIHIPDTKSLEDQIAKLDILVTYGISNKLFNKRSNRLKWIHVGASGIDDNLFDDLIKSRVMITNAKGINSNAVTEFIISQMMYFAKLVGDCNQFKQSKQWNQWELARETKMLSDSTLGIIGYGEIGKNLSRKAKSFGMKVIATRRLQKHTEKKKFVDFLLPTSKIEKIFKKSDYLSVACPLTPQTNGMINKKLLNLMKKSSVFINTSRGRIVNETDLIDILKKKQIKGAALDVFAQEPLDSNSELFRLENVFLSPHISGNFSGYQENMIIQFGEMLNKYLDNKTLKNRVCKKRLY